jgi:hypothetical protein
MQYHYVVAYDTDTKKWFVELDVDAYFPDGHVWDRKQMEESPAGYGWRGAEDNDILDQTLLNTLYYIVDTIPIPKEHEDAL